MDPAIGELRDIDVCVCDGAIAEVGHRVKAAGEVVEAQGMLLLPGFIDTHWHLWNTVLRPAVGDGPGRDYFTVKRAVAPHMEPEDHYWSARLALAEAVDAGITTVHNWDHNVRSPADADANITAQLDSGLRGRFSYGPPDSSEPQRPNDLRDITLLTERWPPERVDGRLSFGIAVRGPYRTPRDVCVAEWGLARQLGLPITMHCDRCLREADCARCGLDRLEHLGLLGPDVQIVHAVHASEADIAALARTNTHVSVSPMTEMRTMGFPQITELVEAGVLVSLSLDTLAMPTNADVLGHMRTVLSVERARRGSPQMTARRVLEMATIDAARDLGLEAITGSVTPGKRADLILLSTSELQDVPGWDPVEFLLYVAQSASVDTVIADGRVMKRDASSTVIGPTELSRSIQGRVAALLRRAGFAQATSSSA
ncbi:MAG TPA: amidohydrolase family protein [Solirubrobacteraceae bacterium]|jgi:cytosine/adenosine deaminase-related metal-dependent hydrolase